MKRWRGNLAVGAALLAAALAGAQTNIIEISNTGGPWVTTNGALAELSWDYNVKNYANIVTNWNEMCTEVKLYDIYSVTNPVPLNLAPDWVITTTAGSATNYWDVTFNCNDSIGYIESWGDSRNFSIATYVPTNAVGRLVIATRRGQGFLNGGHNWQPVDGDGYLGPVGLGLVVAGASAVVGVSNTLAGAGYALETATNGLAGGLGAGHQWGGGRDFAEPHRDGCEPAAAVLARQRAVVGNAGGRHGVPSLPQATGVLCGRISA